MIAHPGDVRVRRLLDLLQGEYVGMYGEPDPNPDGDLARAVPPTGGVVLLVPTSAEAVAVGGWTEWSPGVACLRRVYVHWSQRRRGHGRVLMSEVEGHARQLGMRRMILEVGTVQTAALTMYRSMGYAPHDPFGYYAGQVTSVFLGKDLRDHG